MWRKTLKLATNYVTHPLSHTLSPYTGGFKICASSDTI